MKTDTLEQIDTKLINMAIDKSPTLGKVNNLAEEILAIAIQSPEAAEYWFEKVTDEYRNYKGFRHFDDDLSQENRDSIIEALKEAQSE